MHSQEVRMFGHAGCSKQGRGPMGFASFPFQRMNRMRGGACGPWALLRELELTDEQIEKFAELKMEGLGNLSQFKFSMAGLAHQAGDELSKQQIDKAKVKEIAKQMKAKQAEFADSMIERILSFAEVLTFDQRKKLRLAGIKRFLGLNSGSWSETEQQSEE